MKPVQERWTLRVTGIRSIGKTNFGGCIFTARAIDEAGNVLDAGSYMVVKASGAALGGALVQVGQWWDVTGACDTRSREVNGFLISELQVDAKAARLMRPSSEHLVAFMADCPDFRGIGRVKAQRLWESFGERLYEVLDAGDPEALHCHLAPETADMIVAAWVKHGDTRTLQWLQAQGFDSSLGKKVVEFFGSEAAQKIEEDPYRLLSFCGHWRQVDSLALSHFKVPTDDPRRLQAAVEEACYRLFGAGHTTAMSAAAADHLQGILGPQTSALRWRGLVNRALSSGLTNGSFVVGPHGVQPLGAYVMERQIAQTVADRLTDTASTPLLPSAAVEEVILAFERAAGGITLNAEQREAVHLAAEKRFLLITGGAGVGKTTVLRAIYDVFDAAGLAVTQLALAGRATMRMKEATHRAASTIANFLHTFKEGQLDAPCVVVVDEASMVDVITMSRLCDKLPAHARLILVGDPGQLMPVGPGLVLHALVRVPKVPSVELKVVERFGDEIAAAATAVRDGYWPGIVGSELSPVVFVHAQSGGRDSAAEAIDDAVLRLYQQDPADTQVLCARKSSIDGVERLNERCQRELSANGAPVVVWNHEHEQETGTGLRIGDAVVCTRNLWDRGLQNGSLGTVAELGMRPTALSGGFEYEERVLAWIDWDDNIRRPLTKSMLDDISLGFAITVHKGQGSQWQRVIVPITENRLLDRTLIYTAMTRARRQVVLVGDEVAARAAVEREPHVRRRQVALDLILEQMLAQELTSAAPLAATAA